MDLVVKHIRAFVVKNAKALDIFFGSPHPPSKLLSAYILAKVIASAQLYDFPHLVIVIPVLVICPLYRHYITSPFH